MQQEQAFLGTGWAFPPYFIPQINSAATTSGQENIHQSLQILLNTSIGQRIMEFNYGASLNSLVFNNLTSTLENQIIDAVQQAVLMHEPRINTEGVTLSSFDNKTGLIEINIEYATISTNTRNNFVYPFFLKEGTNLTQTPAQLAQ